MMEKTQIFLPAKGFYRHYKHDPKGEPYNYYYEVTGIGRHTEDETLTVEYRPLYESDWLPPADHCVRRLQVFMSSVEINGQMKPRFEHITDPETIKILEAVKNVMYGY